MSSALTRQNYENRPCSVVEPQVVELLPHMGMALSVEIGQDFTDRSPRRGDAPTFRQACPAGCRCSPHPAGMGPAVSQSPVV
jgi:hypothetical protein